MKTTIAAFVSLLVGMAAGSAPALAQSAAIETYLALCNNDGDAETFSIENRVSPPDPEILDIFSGSGASDISTHALTKAEQVQLERAFQNLSQLHQDVLRRHLRRLSFLALKPGSGSALTSRVEGDATVQKFDITLRSSLLNESLTLFLNTKETRLFENDGSGTSIAFDAGDSDALIYVLLHEATHIVDQVLGLSDDRAHPLAAGLWADARELAAPYVHSPLAKTRFRGAPPIPLATAPEVYKALGNSPFVTFYATAAAPEDLAELFAWQHLATHLDQSLTLDVMDDKGHPIFSYDPLATPQVVARFAEVEKVHDQYRSTCRAGSP